MFSCARIVLAVLTVLPLVSKSQEICPLVDIALIIDQSGSILTAPGGYTNWQDSILEFGAQLAHALPIGPDSIRMGVVKFSNDARVVINLDEYPDSFSLEYAIRDLEYAGGETNIAEALHVGRNFLYDDTLGARDGVGKIAILISDGRANLNKSLTQVEGNKTRAAGITIFCVGVTNRNNDTELKGIATTPSSRHYYTIYSQEAINRTINNILTEICAMKDTLINSTVSTASLGPVTDRPSGSSSSSSTSLIITSDAKDAGITTSKPYTSRIINTIVNTSTTATINSSNYSAVSSSTTSKVTTTSASFNTPTASSPTQPLVLSTILVTSSNIFSSTSAQSCSRRADIALIIDESRSQLLSGNGWFDFLHRLVNAFPIASTLVRMGVVAFSTRARVVINLGQYNDVTSLEKAIINLRFQDGERNIADGLHVARDLLFSSSRGARSGVRKVAFLISSGSSTENKDQLNMESIFTKMAGVEIFCFGVSNQTDEIELQRIASFPVSTHYYHASDYDSLGPLVPRSVEEFCSGAKMTMSSVFFSATTPSTTQSSSTRLDNAGITSMQEIKLQNSTSANISTRTLNTSVTQASQPTSFTDSSSITGATSTLSSPSSGIFSSLSTSNFSSYTSYTRLSTAETIRTSSADTRTMSSSAATLPALFNTTLSNILLSNSSTRYSDTSVATSTTSQFTMSFLNSSPTSLASTNIRSSTSITPSFISSSESTVTRVPTASTPSARTPSFISSAASTWPTTSTSKESNYYSTETTTTPTSTTVMPCPKQIDIVLILDETTSIVAAPGGYENWYGYILGFAEGLINVFQVDPDLVRIGVIKFSWNARILITFDQYTNAATLVKAVKNLTIEGGQTNIAAALRVGRTLLFNKTLGARENAKKLLFLVTDGGANVEYEKTYPEADLTKADGVEIYCIGVTSNINNAELVNIASEPVSAHYYFVSSYNLLNDVLLKLRSTICFALQLSTTASTMSETTSPT